MLAQFFSLWPDALYWPVYYWIVVALISSAIFFHINKLLGCLRHRIHFRPNSYAPIR
jgi:hypothetical protein